MWKKIDWKKAEKKRDKKSLWETEGDGKKKGQANIPSQECGPDPIPLVQNRNTGKSAKGFRKVVPCHSLKQVTNLLPDKQ